MEANGRRSAAPAHEPNTMLKSLELKIPPAAVWFLCATAMAGIARQTPSFARPFPGRIVLALGLAGLGAGLGFAGVLAFRRRRTTVNPHRPEVVSAMVAGSIYRFTRNPMYLGLLLMLLAWAAYLAHPLACAVVPLFVPYMNRFQILPEERALRAKFGKAFADYAKSVRRWM